ncbi:hypothetical protein B5M09_011169 [Aphanomyces astaci]|uniref:Uncharacterized protein n=1 Tax=Aphanomyces astaci TaxID=112090 RepID=A0A3R8DJ89_APHAT|nr:hypothetical protein B5M09_011169 [Aphanomyces astaci]
MTTIQHRAGADADVPSAVDDEIDDKKDKAHERLDVSRWIYVAFCAETCASVMLAATFNTFHVETFLTDYKLDLSSYATGHVIYAVINTLNDIVGAVLLDSLALTTVLQQPYSFCAIAGGSLLTEMDISDSQRIHMWHKSHFRMFCIGLAILSGLCFGVFYYAYRRAYVRRRHSAPSNQLPPTFVKNFMGEFSRLSNFHAWLGMEMCLETQSNFNRTYLRLFVTTFVKNEATAATFVSVLPVLKQMIKLAAFSALDYLGVYE